MFVHSALIYGVIQLTYAEAAVCTNTGHTCRGNAPLCRAGQMPCSDGRVCIMLDWSCDDVDDCPDASDEVACPLLEPRRCGPHQLQCRGDGVCLHLLDRCDGVSRCEDGSDEMACAASAPVSPCEEGQFQCERRAYCIHNDQLCDGTDDCTDGSDEQHCCYQEQFRCDMRCVEAGWACNSSDCAAGGDGLDCVPPAACRHDQFSCSDGICLPEDDRCDGHPDCADGSDEADCVVSCPDRQFRCPHGACLPQQQVCDGISQCHGGEDEKMCAQPAQCPPEARCEQVCLAPTPNASGNCTCNVGYSLQDDRVSCADLDECARDWPCSHFCHNTAGSYSCSCSEGYQQAADTGRCLAPPRPQPTLLVALRHALDQYKTSGDWFSTLQHSLSNAVYVDYHLARGLLFWLDTSTYTIYRSSLADSATPAAVVVAGLFDPVGLAVDWLHDLLYWAEEPSGSLHVATLSGRWRRPLLAGLDEPRALCLHPQHALLFWSDVGSAARIERANGDGTDRRAIVARDVVWPNGLTLDYPTDTLYWVDAKFNSISACRLDGTDRRQVVGGGVPHPVGLTLFEDSLYWTDWKTRALHVAGKRDGQGARRLVSLEHPMDVRAVHPLRQTGSRSRCLNGAGCSHLCLPRHNASTCTCPSGLALLDGSATTCSDRPSSSLVVALNSTLQVVAVGGRAGAVDAYLVPVQPVGQPRAVAADADSLFWADRAGVHTAFWDGSAHSLLLDSDVGNVTALAVDGAAGLVYWLNAELLRLEVATSDGRVRTLLASDHIDRPTALVVDTAAGTIYWSDLGAEDTAGRIERAGQDGSARSTLDIADLSAPTGLALDVDSRTIYWCDAKLGTIRSGALTATGVGPPRLVFSGLGRVTSLTLISGTLYWTSGSAVHNGSATGHPRPQRQQPPRSRLGPVLALAALAGRPAVVRRSDCARDNGGCRSLCLPAPGGGRTCRCPTGVPLADDGVSCEAGPRTSLMVARNWEVRQLSLDDQHMAATVLPLPRRVQVTAIAWDTRSSRLFYMDTSLGRRRIVRTSVDGLESDPVVTHELADVADMAIDVAGSKLYWVDGGRAALEVSQLDGGRRQLLFHDGMNMPRALAVCHSRGLLFWADWGRVPRIERAWMDGSHRSVVVWKGLGRPAGILVDDHGGLLFWCDNSQGKIESMPLDGTGRRTVVSEARRPFSLALHHPMLYWTEWEPYGAVRRQRLNTSQPADTLVRGLDHIGHLLLVERDMAVVRHACSSDDVVCVGLCLRRPDGGTCRCGTGLVPAADGVSCPDKPTAMLLYLTLNSLAQISLDTTDRWEVTMPVTGIHGGGYLDFLHADNAVIFTDRILRQIRWADLRTPPAEPARVLVSGRDLWPEAVAVDWPARLVFFTSTQQPALWVVAVSGCCRRRLLQDDLRRPVALAVLPLAGLLVWADVGPPARLERARLDGSQRRPLITDTLKAPTGLTAEPDRIYWADWELERVESCDLDGHDRRTLVEGASHPFGVTTLGNHLYWSDWETLKLERINKWNGSDRTVVANRLEGIMDVVAVTAERQAGTNVCSTNNGGCSHLCLYLGGGQHVCACPDSLDQRPCSVAAHPQADTVVDQSDGLAAYLATAGGLILLLLVIAVVVVLRRTRLAARAPDHEATLTFSNPTYNSSASDFSNDKRFSWRKAKYDKTQDVGAGGPAGLEAAALIDGVTVDHNSSTPPLPVRPGHTAASDPGDVRPLPAPAPGQRPAPASHGARVASGPCQPRQPGDVRPE